jgi:hypothetical protein
MQIWSSHFRGVVLRRLVVTDVSRQPPSHLKGLDNPAMSPSTNQRCITSQKSEYLKCLPLERNRMLMFYVYEINAWKCVVAIKYCQVVQNFLDTHDTKLYRLHTCCTQVHVCERVKNSVSSYILWDLLNILVSSSQPICFEIHSVGFLVTVDSLFFASFTSSVVHAFPLAVGGGRGDWMELA